MNYYDENLYYLMYADSKLNIKLKMRKSHACYRIQLNVFMHASRIVTCYDLLPRERGVSVEERRN